MDTNERAELYTQFLEAAAKEYRCAPTDMPAKMAASRRLSFEVYTAQLIEGRNPDPATLRLFLEEEARFAPPPAPIDPVKIEIVETLVGICQRCGFEHQTGKPVTDPDPPPSPPKPPTPPTETKPSPPASSAAPTNVVELPRPRSAGNRSPTRCAGSISCAVMALRPMAAWVEEIRRAAARSGEGETHDEDEAAADGRRLRTDSERA
jgi:hypothetical protein